MKRLYRDRWNKKLGGVLGGLGQYLKVDPSLLRLIFVFVMCLTAFLPMLVVYLIAWLLMPEGPKVLVEPKYKRLYRSRKKQVIAGICGGLSDYTKIDATVIRICVLVAFLITGIIPILATYFVGTAIIPERPKPLSP